MGGPSDVTIDHNGSLLITGGYPRLHRIRDVADYFAGLEKLDNLVNDRNRETYWTRVRLPTPPHTPPP